MSETTDSTRVYDYVYTTAGRLKQVKRGSNILEHYEYDANGNRTTAVRWLAGGAATANATYDAQDRMTLYGGVSYTYTANGELLRRIAGTDTTKYTYDQLGNLLEVKLPGGMAVTYKVDGRNRRVAKLVDGTFKRGWIYQDGLRVVGELDSTGALAIRYVYGSRSHVPDYLVRYGTTYRLITDQLGSVRQVVDASSGTVAESITYDAWGRITSQQSPGFVSVAYAGGLYDHHTGLTRFGARDYDATVGRWTCKDPTGLLGGPNAYSYVACDPLNFVDPAGFKHHTAGETKRILEKARRDAAGLGGPLRAYRNHAVPGVLDPKKRSSGDTYQVGTRCFRADEFGNFLAGYAGYHTLDGFGIVFVTAGGWWFDWFEDFTVRRPFNHDEDSRPDVEAGYEYAAYEEALRGLLSTRMP